MVKAIIINNPSERPFGPLSNKAFVYLTIDNKLYSSVTNYIYSSLLTFPIHKKSLQHTSISHKIPQGISKKEYDQRVKFLMENVDGVIKDSDSINNKILENFDVFQLYKYYNSREIYSVKLESLRKAYSAKFRNPKLQKILFKTGNAQLKYVSNTDLFFGVSQENNGYNAVGKILTQLRSRLRNEKRIRDEEIRKKKFIDNLYNIYVADFILKEAIKDGDFLDQYVGKTPEEIIKIYQNETPIRKKGLQIYVEKRPLPYGIVAKKYILELFLNEKLNLNVMREFYNKGTLVQTNRKEGLEQIIDIRKKKRREIIFDMYLKYMLRKNYENIDTKDYQAVINSKKPVDENIDEEMVKLKINVKKHTDFDKMAPKVKAVFDVGIDGQIVGTTKKKPKFNIEVLTEGKDKHEIKKAMEEEEEKPEIEVDLGIIKENIISGSISKTKYEDLKSRVVDLFNLGMLSASLSNKIDEELEKIRIPTQEEIDDAKKIIVPKAVEKQIVDIEKIQKYQDDIRAKRDDTPLDPLMKLLMQDDTTKDKTKEKLIRDILRINVNDTALKYQNMSIEELEHVLNKSKSKPKANRKTKEELIKDLALYKKADRTDFENYSEEQLIQEIKEYEDDEEEDKDDEEDDGRYRLNNNEIIEINKNNDNPDIDIFSPYNYYKMITINGLKYPTIYNYMMCKLLSRIMLSNKSIPVRIQPELQTQLKAPKIETVTMQTLYEHKIRYTQGISIEKARLQFLTDYINYQKSKSGAKGDKGDKGAKGDRGELRIVRVPIYKDKIRTDFISDEDVRIVYTKIYNNTIQWIMNNSNKQALNVKFKDRSLQNLLLSTMKLRLIYADNHSLYLGSGTKKDKGVNIVGKQLEIMRNEIIVKRQEESDKPIIIRPKIISKIIVNNKILREWVKGKLEDMCSVVYATHEYMKMKHGSNDINIVFIKYIINYIYEPCQSIFGRMENITSIEVPQYFINMVESCPSMRLTNPEKYNELIRKAKLRRDNNIRREAKQYGYYTETYRDELDIKSFDLGQNEDYTKFIKQLYAKNITQSDIEKEIKKFKKKQEKERNEYIGIVDKKIPTKKKERDEYNRKRQEYEDIIKKIKGVYNDKIYNIKKNEKAELDILKHISQIYWKHIIIMITTVINIIEENKVDHKKSKLSLLDVISVLSAAQYNTSKPKNCKTIIKNNEFDNCIAVALYNLLQNIIMINSKVIGGRKSKLRELDLRLATSIILNKAIGSVNIGKKDKKDLGDTKIPNFEDFDEIYYLEQNAIKTRHKLEKAKEIRKLDKKYPGLSNRTKYDSEKAKIIRELNHKYNKLLDSFKVVEDSIKTQAELDKNKRMEELDLKYSLLYGKNRKKNPEEIKEELHIIKEHKKNYEYSLELEKQIYLRQQKEKYEKEQKIKKEDESKEDEKKEHKNIFDISNNQMDRESIRSKITDLGLDESEDENTFIDKYLSYIEFIKKDKLSRNIKINRVNFFSYN